PEAESGELAPPRKRAAEGEHEGIARGRPERRGLPRSVQPDQGGRFVARNFIPKDACGDEARNVARNFSSANSAPISNLQLDPRSVSRIAPRLPGTAHNLLA